MSLLNDKTPIERYTIRSGHKILVKREDLCCPPPGPSFSKMRGVVAHLQQRPEQTIGVLDTYHSKAGWAVAWACRQLGKQCINYWPRYKKDPREGLPRYQQQMAQSFGADMRALPAGRSFILYNQARKQLAENYANSYMIPNALKLPESITENAAEVRRTRMPREGTVIISVSSATVAAGILWGMHLKGNLSNYNIILHMGYSRSNLAVRKYIQQKVPSLSEEEIDRFVIIDEGYNYKDRVEIDVPFPCNPYYDAKAWNWLVNGGAQGLKEPIVFWNIGD